MNKMSLKELADKIDEFHDRMFEIVYTKAKYLNSYDVLNAGVGSMIYNNRRPKVETLLILDEKIQKILDDNPEKYSKFWEEQEEK